MPSSTSFRFKSLNGDYSRADVSLVHAVRFSKLATSHKLKGMPGIPDSNSWVKFIAGRG